MKCYFVGPVELAAVGVSIAIFNQISKITIIPLVSVTTSLVAEEDAAEQNHQSEKEILLEESVVNGSVKVDIHHQAEKAGNHQSEKEILLEESVVNESVKVDVQDQAEKAGTYIFQG